MPETARVLSFPVRRLPQRRSPAEALRSAAAYLELEPAGRTHEIKRETLTDVDVLLAMCSLVKDLLEVSPKLACEEASSVYQWIKLNADSLGLFDEREYVLGESARLAGWASKFIGKYDEAERWLNRADAAFRNTVNPAPVLANVAFGRLALKFEMKQFAEVEELLPSLVGTFARLGMAVEVAKCRFMQARLLQELGRINDAYQVLAELRNTEALAKDRALHGQVLVYIGYYHATAQEYEKAVEAYQAAVPVIQSGNRPFALAELKWALADTYKGQGNNEAAVEAYRAAGQAFRSLGMPKFVAMLHLATAETLLEAGRAREAEWEILAALPIVDEQKMVSEGFAAVMLLQQSVREKRTDLGALRSLRTHLNNRS